MKKKHLHADDVLAVLQAGCDITFKSGYKLTSDLSEGYIRLSSPFGNDGAWSLDIQGAKSALLDAKRFELSQNTD